MKITPLEIRQKEFEKKLRGYDKDEVKAFLFSLSNEWERVLDENRELTIKLRQTAKEVEKLRDVENSLFKTLKTAEDTGANLIDQANKAAELHLKETQMNAEALLNESKSKARAMIEKAEEESRHVMDELHEAVKNIEHNHRDIENSRQNAIFELRNLSIDLMDKIERITKEKENIKFDNYVKRVKALARKRGSKIEAKDTTLKMPAAPKMKLPQQPPKTVPSPPPPKTVPSPPPPTLDLPGKEAPKPVKEAKRTPPAPEPRIKKKPGPGRRPGSKSFFDELD